MQGRKKILSFAFFKILYEFRKDELSRLEHILTRVGKPDFGICVKCRQTIPLGRILIKPESVYCVNCAG